MLGAILKRFYPTFDMLTFSNRLKLQKIVYLMKAKGGFDLEFDFNFFVYGPYSTDLARTGFRITDYASIPEVRFKDEGAETDFKNFVSFIGERKNDDRWLECASSILFLSNYTKNKKDIIKRIENKRTKFEEQYINKVWGDLYG